MLDTHELIFAKPIQGKLFAKRMLLINHDTHHYGLIIDSIIGMKSFHGDKGVDEVPAGFDYDHIDHISAFYISGEEWYAALSIQSLLSDDRFGELRNLY